MCGGGDGLGGAQVCTGGGFPFPPWTHPMCLSNGQTHFLFLFLFFEFFHFCPPLSTVRQVHVILPFVQSRPLWGLALYQLFIPSFCSCTFPVGTHMSVLRSVCIHVKYAGFWVGFCVSSSPACYQREGAPCATLRKHPYWEKMPVPAPPFCGWNADSSRAGTWAMGEWELFHSTDREKGRLWGPRPRQDGPTATLSECESKINVSMI